MFYSSLSKDLSDIMLSWDKLHALLYLRTKYENENRAEEAAIASKLVHKGEADETQEYDGF
jgi:hypothetical protein